MVSGEIHVVGNTVLDNIAHLKDKSEYGNEVLVTLHRRENYNLMYEWFQVIEKFAANHPELRFIFPMHPSPQVQCYSGIFKYVNVIKPMRHDDLIDTMLNCKFIITV